MIGTKFNLFDQSAIPEIPTVEEYDDSPVILTAFASSKGTEEFFELKGQEFLDMFGTANFKAFGQTSIQNQRMIEAGAKLVGKRIVADDADLANVIIVANLHKTEVQKKNDDGDLLYYDSSMNETTEAETTEAEDNDPVMLPTAHIKYSAISINGAKTLEQVIDSAADHLDNEGTDVDGVTVYTYPVFAITDNGRGESKKRFLISPEVSISKNLSFMFYNLKVLEEGNPLQSARFAAAPDTAYRGENIELSQVSNTYLTQVKAHSFSSNIELFVDKLSDLSLIETEELLSGDPIFGTNIKGNKYKTISVDTDNGIDISAAVGVGLVNGSNGLFGNNPFQDPVALGIYNAKVLEFFDGTDNDDIYNVDQYQIDAVFDADLPLNIKNAIVELAEYRGDFMFYRDYGKKIFTIDDVVSSNALMTKSKYASDFCQAYEILDPYSKKNTPVTIIYTISRLLISHLKDSRNKPFAGVINNAVMVDAIKGTLNYAPKITPLIDEKTELEDLRVNFASYFRDRLVIESLYTTQEKHTQLSYTNNVLALQRVHKALRVLFPAIRYQFISSEEDLNNYTASINETLTLFANDFEELSFAYVPDKLMLANKIFKATLTYRFKEFAQAEIIDAYIFPTETSVN